jgi:hypothetical protein
MPPRTKKPSVVKELVDKVAHGVKKRGGGSGPRQSKITTRPRATLPIVNTNLVQIEKTQRFEAKLIRNVYTAFEAMPECASGWRRLSPTAQNKKIHDGVLATLMLKEFYASARRKGIKFAVFKNRRSQSAPIEVATAKNLQNHLIDIFNRHDMREEFVTNDAFFHEIPGFDEMGFDRNFLVPVDILNRAKQAGATKRLPIAEKARFQEAYDWLRERTPPFVTTWVTGHLMSNSGLEDWQEYVDKKMRRYNEPRMLYISPKFFRPAGATTFVPKSRDAKRGRGYTSETSRKIRQV